MSASSSTTKPAAQHILIAANSDGGRRMLERRHSLKIGEQGIVGYRGVARRAPGCTPCGRGRGVLQQSRPAADEIRGCAATSQRARTIIGVLDVQSTEEDAFSPDDLRILGVLADQVSLAFENARLFEATPPIVDRSRDAVSSVRPRSVARHAA